MLIFRWEGFCTDEFPLLSMRFRGLCVSLHDYKRSAMLEDFKLKVFVEVAREKSFTRAAAALSISQPAVSQNIAELEKQLGTKLFVRRRGEVLLTDAGQVFLSHAEKILEEYSRAGDFFGSFPHSEVRISVSEEIYSNMVAPALGTFVKVHPEVSFVRCMFGDADVRIFLRPAAGLQLIVPEDTLARVRVSVSRPSAIKTGDQPATLETTSYYDVVFEPSPAFSCTRLCRLLRESLIS